MYLRAGEPGMTPNKLTPNKLAPNPPRNLPGAKPRNDEERDTRNAIIQDADKTDGNSRDLVHGDGGTIDLPVKPGDVSKDD